MAACLLVLCGSAASATPDEAARLRAVHRLVQAAASGDERAMQAALSRRSSLGYRSIRSSLAPFAGGGYRPIVNTPADRGLGVVGIARGKHAFAAPVRLERGEWKVELARALTVDAVRPLPEERVVRRTQLAAEVAAPGTIVGAAMWLDGRFFDARLYWSENGRRMSMWGEAPQPLRSGRHVVVAFASTRTQASAKAWAFTVRGTGSGSRSPARTSP